MKIQVKEENVRLDQYLAKELDVSRSQVLKMIKNDEVLVNGKKVKVSEMLPMFRLIRDLYILSQGGTTENTSMRMII